LKEIEVTGVAFKPAGKIYDFISCDVHVVHGEHVVVETEKGEDIAAVILSPRPMLIKNMDEMKKVIRKASKEDYERQLKNKEDEPTAFNECKSLVVKHNLDMKLLKAEYTLDRSKLTFFFTSDGRVDFRALVRDLARIFRTRIEMRQVGVRDATKMLGGFGLCGKEFCCSTFLRKFDNISIKMAKDQNLILNPTKISGVCGRLMCCLLYEKESYSGIIDEHGNTAKVEFIEGKPENEGGNI
jgi:cell fate regulator YaaT (PSP1 superfamily)